MNLKNNFVFNYIHVFVLASLNIFLLTGNGFKPSSELLIGWTGPGGVMVERSLGVRKVVGSIPSRDIPKVVKRWYK